MLSFQSVPFHCHMFKRHFYLNVLLKVTDDLEKRSQTSQILTICFDSNVVFQCWRMNFLSFPQDFSYTAWVQRCNPSSEELTSWKNEREYNQKPHALCWPTTIPPSPGHSEGSCQNHWANRNEISSLCSLFSHESEWPGIISSFLINAVFSYSETLINYFHRKNVTSWNQCEKYTLSNHKSFPLKFSDIKEKNTMGQFLNTELSIFPFWTVYKNWNPVALYWKWEARAFNSNMPLPSSMPFTI